MKKNIWIIAGASALVLLSVTTAIFLFKRPATNQNQISASDTSIEHPSEASLGNLVSQTDVVPIDSLDQNKDDKNVSTPTTNAKKPTKDGETGTEETEETTFSVPKDILDSIQSGELSDKSVSLLQGINQQIDCIPIYLEAYYTDASKQALQSCLQEYATMDVKHTSEEDLETFATRFHAAFNGLTYQTGSVPRVYITTNDRVADQLSKDTGYVNSTIAVASTDGFVIEELNSAKIKVRGNSTALSIKKPYNIKFTEKQSVLGMGSGKKWVLLADFFDPTMMRNNIALDFASQMGLAYTSNKQVVEVYMDGIYRGCYLMCEPVEDGADRVDLDKSAGDFLIMYEKDRTDPSATYVVSSLGYRFEIREPEHPDAGDIAHITDIINRLEGNLVTGDYGKASSYIDTESFAKYYVVNEYLKTADLATSSVYFYYKGGKMHAGPIWDYDLSMGNSSNANIATTELFLAVNTCWIREMFLYADFDREVQAQYSNAQGYISNLYCSGGKVDQLEATYGACYDRNFSDTIYELAYVQNSLNGTISNSRTANVTALKNWLQGRHAWLNANLATLVPCSYLLSANGTAKGNVLKWNSVGKGYQYQILRQNADGGWSVIAIVSDSTTSYTDTNAKVGVSYNYSILTTCNGQRAAIFDQRGRQATRLEAKNTPQPTKPAETKPAETKPTETKPTETAPIITQPEEPVQTPTPTPTQPPVTEPETETETEPVTEPSTELQTEEAMLMERNVDGE